MMNKVAVGALGLGLPGISAVADQIKKFRVVVRLNVASERLLPDPYNVHVIVAQGRI